MNGLKFTLTQDMQWVGQSSTTSACDSGGVGSNSILQVTESVTWAGAGATAPVRSTTVLSPPAGAYSAATGSIAAKVLNAAGLPVVDAQVSISGPMSQAQNTTTGGLRVLRVPHAGRVHGEGHRRAPASVTRKRSSRHSPRR